MGKPKTFWCIGCETDHLIEDMSPGGLCPQCAATFSQQARSRKDIVTIYLCFFGLGLIALAVIAGLPFQ